MPAFGTTAIKDMFDDMNDIAMQLVMKWERFGPGAVVTPAEDFTRLAFDTIAFCSMSHRYVGTLVFEPLIRSCDVC